MAYKNSTDRKTYNREYYRMKRAGGIKSKISIKENYNPIGIKNFDNSLMKIWLRRSWFGTA